MLIEEQLVIFCYMFCCSLYLNIIYSIVVSIGNNENQLESRNQVLKDNFLYELG